MRDQNERDEADVIATFQIIQAHLRAKGHDAVLDDSDAHLHLACRGVLIDRPANAPIAVTALNGRDLATVIAALADLELDTPARAELLDEIVTGLGRIDPPPERESWWSADGDPACELPCELADALDCGACDFGQCDLGACDVPGCDL